ncbi:uncharacterized protein LOC119836283 [Zerene cesonia]|uniref:uncharacterized protein LOC119836283 n=1 Tax=Zerene cesonia TaxID=33412 RepID=UPI0018E4DBD5|nr:uncharacterized protein LOC119836283 [Zerene cesonia]
MKSKEELEDVFETTIGQSFEQSQTILSPRKDFAFQDPDYSMNTLKLRLQSTIQSATELADTLKRQIKEIEAKESLLKEAIVQGKSGVTTLTITSLDKMPRSYIIRNGFWTICSGMIQSPISAPSPNIFNEIFSTPRCIGQEIRSIKDPCAFNSIIKYETIPTVRRSYYDEDDYLCLKTNFNSTLEHYASVPKQMVNETCKNGLVKSLADNISNCGVRILLEYTYYPSGNFLAADLPLDYCTEADGSCKLLVAWHLSNTTIENFDILNNDKLFKKTFMKTGSFAESII